MGDPAILHPMFALAGLTGAVLLLILAVRVRAVRRRQIGIADFSHGESPAVPDAVRLPNRNYMSLLELPVLFYVVCLIFYVAVPPAPEAVWLAWAYVVLRALHSAVHLTYNHVLHRLLAFAASNGVLVAMWILAAMRLAS